MEQKKMKVQDLQPGPQMDALVAEALGYTLRKGMSEAYDVWERGEFDDDILVDDYNPSGNGGQAMELVKAFKIDFAFGRGPLSRHEAAVYTSETGWSRAEGETPEIAICRAVIASRFGKTVEVEE